METKERVDKLVRLALSTESPDEAAAAIRQARKAQPKGTLIPATPTVDESIKIILERNSRIFWKKKALENYRMYLCEKNKVKRDNHFLLIIFIFLVLTTLGIIIA